MRRLRYPCVWLGLCLVGAVAAARPVDYVLIGPRPGSGMSHSAPDFPLSLFGAVEEESEDEVLEAILPPQDPLIGRLDLLRPNGLARERCRFPMRNLLRIGHGASPDGRPQGCRLAPFLRRLRMREAGRRRTAPNPLRFRFDGVPIPQLMARRSPRFFYNASPGSTPTGARLGGSSAAFWFMFYSPSPPRMMSGGSPFRPAAPPPDPAHIPAAIRVLDGRRGKIADAR